MIANSVLTLDISIVAKVISFVSHYFLLFSRRIFPRLIIKTNFINNFIMLNLHTSTKINGMQRETDWINRN